MSAPTCTEAETPFGEVYCALHGERWPCPHGGDPVTAPEPATPGSDSVRAQTAYRTNPSKETDRG